MKNIFKLLPTTLLMIFILPIGTLAENDNYLYEKIVKYRILVLLLICLLFVSCSNSPSDGLIGDGGCLNLTIMVNNNIYTHNKTYRIDEVDFIKEGTIASSVSDTEVPYKNNQSNFGKGYEYDIVSDQIIYVKYNKDLIYEFLRAD